MPFIDGNRAFFKLMLLFRNCRVNLVEEHDLDLQKNQSSHAGYIGYILNA